MNLPHGSTVVDFAFYTDAGLDAVRCSVRWRARPCGFDRRLLKTPASSRFSRAGEYERGRRTDGEPTGGAEGRSRDANDIAFSTYGLELSDGGYPIGEFHAAKGDADSGGAFNLELLGGAGSRSAAAVAGGAQAENRHAAPVPRSTAHAVRAREDHPKFLAEHGALDDEVDPAPRGPRQSRPRRRRIFADSAPLEDTLDATEEIRVAASALVAVSSAAPAADADAIRRCRARCRARA